MSVPCDIKSSIEAWNHGVVSFMNAMKVSNNATKSIKYALKELSTKYPDLKFDSESFTKPIIEKLKQEGLVKDDYTFKGNKNNEVEKIVSKFKGLDEKQSKELSKKIFEKSFKNGMVNEQDIKNAYSEMKGYPSITPEFTKLIDEVANDRQAYESVDSKIKNILGEIQSLKKEKKYTTEKEKDFSKQLDKLKKEKIVALENYIKSDLKFGEMLSKDRHFIYQFGDIMKMNLMSPISLLKNTTGMAGDAVFRNLSNLIAAPISYAVLGVRKAMGKTSSTALAPKIVSHTTGGVKGDALSKAYIAAKYGVDPVYTDKLRAPNYVDAVRNVKKIVEGDDKIKNTVQAIFKISSTGISRGLSAPDFLFQEMAENSELNRIGNEKGYKGAELKAFMLAPDENSADIAREYGKKITYKQGMPLEDFFKKIDFAKIGDSMIENGANPMLARLLTGTGHIVKNIIMPFTTTPINILRGANRIVLPEYTLLKGFYDARQLTGDEKTNKIISTIADATVGFHIRMIALNLISQGLISAGYDDEEDKVREIIEKKTGGPNRVNINAIWRGITFEDIKERKSDRYVDINSLGTLGIAFGAYAHAYNKYGKEDLQKQIDYLKNGNYLTVPANTAVSQLSSALDFTFFSGWNESFKALKGEGNDREKWLQNSLMTVMGGFLPATHQILSKSETESRPKSYDKDLTFSQNVYNQMGYKFFFQVPDKTFKVLTENGEKTERIKEHYMFDNYWGRVLAASDPFKSKVVENPNTPTAKLYNEMRKVDKKQRDDLVPGYVSDKVKIKGNDILLTPGQYDYFQSQSSLHRMGLATPFIMSHDFDKMDFDEKSKVLKNLYEEGRQQALKEVQQKFYPDIRRNRDHSDKEVERMSKKYKKKQQ